MPHKGAFHFRACSHCARARNRGTPVSAKGIFAHVRSVHTRRGLVRVSFSALPPRDSEPASHPASQPASQPTSHAASQPASQPGSQAAKQPNSQAAASTRCPCAEPWRRQRGSARVACYCCCDCSCRLRIRDVVFCRSGLPCHPFVPSCVVRPAPLPRCRAMASSGDGPAVVRPSFVAGMAGRMAAGSSPEWTLGKSIILGMQSARILVF